jgi:hypothetical protein
MTFAAHSFGTKIREQGIETRNIGGCGFSGLSLVGYCLGVRLHGVYEELNCCVKAKPQEAERLEEELWRWVEFAV